MSHFPARPVLFHLPPCGSSDAGAAGPNTEAHTGALPERNEMDPAFQWKVERIFSTSEAWERALEETREALPRLAAFRGRIGEGADTLADCLRTLEELLGRMDRVHAYAFLSKDTDTRNPEYQERYERAHELAVALEETMAFIEPGILALPEERLRAFRREKGLAPYAHLLEDLERRREHVLPEAFETLLARAGHLFRAPSDTFHALADTDLVFPSIRDEAGRETPLTHARYYVYRGSRDRRVRRDNEEAFHGTFRKFRNTLAALLRAQVHRARFEAEARHYPSTLHAALHGPNIPVEAYRNLVKGVRANLEPLHRYTALRAKVLGLASLHGYDLYCSLVPDAEPEVPWPEAKTLVAEALSPLGKDYVRTLMQGVDDGWVDVYENAGKRSGAYSAGVYGVHPFVLLNFRDRLEDAFTLAHELGHAMHSYYTHRHQPRIYADYSIFTAETASLVNENLLMHHLLDVTRDRKQRAYLLDFYLDRIRSTFYRQTLFAEFEQEIHARAAEGAPLTPDLMDRIYGDLFIAYYGPRFALDPYKAAEWSRIPHFYREFYVFTYATGFCAAAGALGCARGPASGRLGRAADSPRACGPSSPQAGSSRLASPTSIASTQRSRRTIMVVSPGGRRSALRHGPQAVAIEVQLADQGLAIVASRPHTLSGVMGLKSRLPPRA